MAIGGSEILVEQPARIAWHMIEDGQCRVEKRLVEDDAMFRRIVRFDRQRCLERRLLALTPCEFFPCGDEPGIRLDGPVGRRRRMMELPSADAPGLRILRQELGKRRRSRPGQTDDENAWRDALVEDRWILGDPMIHPETLAQQFDDFALHAGQLRPVEPRLFADTCCEDLQAGHEICTTRRVMSRDRRGLPQHRLRIEVCAVRVRRAGHALTGVDRRRPTSRNDMASAYAAAPALRNVPARPICLLSGRRPKGNSA